MGYQLWGGYDEDDVQIQIDKTSVLNRKKLLEEREKEFKQVNPYVVTYHLDFLFLIVFSLNISG